MPTRPLPRKLVKSVREAIQTEIELQRGRGKMDLNERIYRRLARMPNLDPRSEITFPQWDGSPPDPVKGWGRRVKGVDVHRNWPEGGTVAIKIAHGQGGGARRAIRQVKDRVRWHNKTFNPVRYTLKSPHLYQVHDDLVMSAKSEAPSIREVYGGKPRAVAVLRSAGTNRQACMSAYNELSRNSYFEPNDILVAGYDPKAKKFIFVPAEA